FYMFCVDHGYGDDLRRLSHSIVVFKNVCFEVIIRRAFNKGNYSTLVVSCFYSFVIPLFVRAGTF
ncbi:hypothetical protein, partial [Flavobacterium sp. ACAM 123]|uniref:hypothetical protein n=1 Tax=Flavobacterium sp. ACAM 123 TaxID=1189620 RepID=UPI001E37B7A5